MTVLLVAVACVTATALATVSSPQLGCAFALVLCVALTYVAKPSAGVAVLVVVWLVVAGVRRVLALESGYVGQDPLSVAPVVATAAVAAMAVWRMRFPRLMLVLAGVVCAGMLLGLPAATSLDAAAYSLVAYLGAFSAIILGWSDGHRPLERWTLIRVLALAAPALALYALYQYFVEMPRWDQHWLDSVDFVAVEAPEAGKIRSFASLNAPGLLGIVLAVAVLLYAARRRLVGWTLVALPVTAAGLAVTYVRSAWVAVVAGALALLVASWGRAAPQIARLGLLLLLMVLALSTSGSTYTAFTDRVGTLGSLGQDQSARARTATPAEVLPDLVGRPAGYGLGSAGQATLLAPSSGLRSPDNGYLAMAYQLGLVGGLLVVGALLVAMARALRGLSAARDPDRALIAAFFALFLVALIGGDQFYGFAGVMLWYITGAGLGRSTAARDQLRTL